MLGGKHGFVQYVGFKVYECICSLFSNGDADNDEFDTRAQSDDNSKDKKDDVVIVEITNINNYIDNINYTQIISANQVHNTDNVNNLNNINNPNFSV